MVTYVADVWAMIKKKEKLKATEMYQQLSCKTTIMGRVYESMPIIEFITDKIKKNTSIVGQMRG